MKQIFLEAQIQRMAGLDKYPSLEPGGYAELVRIAGKYGRSGQHLESVIDEIMDSATKCPKPSELRTLLLAGKPSVPVKSDCPVCHGSGWRIVEGEITGAARCECGSAPQGNTNIRYDKVTNSARLNEVMPEPELIPELIPEPSIRAKTPEELAQLDRFRAEEEQLRAVELARRAQQERA